MCAQLVSLAVTTAASLWSLRWFLRKMDPYAEDKAAGKASAKAAEAAKRTKRKLQLSTFEEASACWLGCCTHCMQANVTSGLPSQTVLVGGVSPSELSISLDDVGGLEDVKKELVRCCPLSACNLQFAPLFKTQRSAQTKPKRLCWLCAD